MTAAKRQLALNVFLTRHGHHPGGWRLPGSPGGGNPDFNYWANLVKTAERGKFDAAFFADFVGQSGDEVADIERSPRGQGFEPLTLTSALAAVTSKIGLVATVNINYNEPYNVARRFASLDHLSGGRIAWNVIASYAAGAIKTFGVDDVLEHDLRYEKAGEFIDLAKKIWDSWDDGAFDHPDKASGKFLDASSIHPVNHEGKYYKVNTYLDIARPIQGYPVFVQAGNSDVGREFAAKYAEVIYASAQTLEAAQEFYNDVKGRLKKYGREDDHLKITPGLSYHLGGTEQEAHAKFDALQEAVDLSGRINFWGYDLTGYDLDGPLPDLPEPDTGRGRWKQITDLAKAEKLTIRQLILRYSVVRGHRVVIGTPEQIADKIEDWFLQKGADGFNLIPPLLPGSLDDFVDQVVPLLQKKGIFRQEYQTSTLRGHLGLPRPANPYTKA